MDPSQPNETTERNMHHVNEVQAIQATQIPQATQPTAGQVIISSTQPTVRVNPSDHHIHEIQARQNLVRQPLQSSPADVIDLDDSSLSQLQPYLQNPHTRSANVEQTQNIQPLAIPPAEVQKQPTRQGNQINSNFVDEQVRDNQIIPPQSKSINNEMLAENMVNKLASIQQTQINNIQTIRVKTTEMTISLSNNPQVINQPHQIQFENKDNSNQIDRLPNAENVVMQDLLQDRQQHQTPVFQQSKHILEIPEIPGNTLILEPEQHNQTHPQNGDVDKQAIHKNVEVPNQIAINAQVVVNTGANDMIAQIQIPHHHHLNVNVNAIVNEQRAQEPVAVAVEHPIQIKIGMQVEQHKQAQNTDQHSGQKMIQYKEQIVVAQDGQIKENVISEKHVQININRDGVEQQQQQSQNRLQQVNVKNNQPQQQQNVPEQHNQQEHIHAQPPPQPQPIPLPPSQTHHIGQQSQNTQGHHPTTQIPTQVHQTQEINNTDTHNQQIESSQHGAPELTDINQIRKALLEYLPPHIKSLAETLPDDQLREMYLEIRAEEMKAAAQNQMQPETEQQVHQPKVVTEQPKKETKKKDSPNKVNNLPKKPSPQPTYERQEQRKQSPDVDVRPQTRPMTNEALKNGYGKTIKKERKRVVTTVVQQVEYYDDEDAQSGTSKYVILDNGEVRRKKPANKKQMQGILTQLCSLVRSLDLSAFSDTNLGSGTGPS